MNIFKQDQEKLRIKNEQIMQLRSDVKQIEEAQTKNKETDEIIQLSGDD